MKYKNDEFLAQRSVIQILGKDQKNAIQSQGKDNLDNLTTE